jgi:hypothetical protein
MELLNGFAQEMPVFPQKIPPSIPQRLPETLQNCYFATFSADFASVL